MIVRGVVRISVFERLFVLKVLLIPPSISWRKHLLVRFESHVSLKQSLKKHAVLDGGTGFLKVGYAAQVSEKQYEKAYKSLIET